MSLIVILIVIVILIAALLIALAVIGWRFSSTILVPKPYQLFPEFEVLEVADGQVRLPLVDGPEQFADARQQGLFNLLYEGGYGRLGAILEDDGSAVVRAFELSFGRPPRVGDPARLDNVLFWQGPAERGLEAEELALEGEAGALAAWWLDGGADSAVVILHGRRRGELTETLRFLPVLAERHSVLALSYRNHRGSDPSLSGFYHYGASEYRDLFTGLEFLKEQGVERVVLYGLSTGAALVLEAIERWPAEAPELSGLVLDSPLLDSRTVFRVGAQDLGLPLSDRITDVALFVARLRAGVNWDGLDQRRTAGDIAVPMLLIAGTDDSTIPIALVDDYASLVRAPLSYHRVQGADHVESWNLDPERYQGWLRDFLSER